jgi:hypothetical protein
VTIAIVTVLVAVPFVTRAEAGKGDIARIAEEAFMYGFPIVMNYTVFYQYFIDKTSPQYKAPINQLYHTGHVYTPKYTAVVTPDSDTPYSMLAMDLRAEPFVICNPEIEPSRYFSVQLIDLYTFNYGYMGSRTTGNGAGCFMIAGPRWTGEQPEGIRKMIRSETDFSMAVFRTQLFGPSDIDNVRRIQGEYRALPLSKFLSRPAPRAAPEVAWPKIDTAMAIANPGAYLNFLLTFCPPIGPAAVEGPMRARFKKIGVEAGKPFPIDKLTSKQIAMLQTVVKAALDKIQQAVATMGTDVNGWRVATKGFGDRQMYNGNYTLRAAAAIAGIHGNDAAEALYPMLATDSDGNRPDTSINRYTLTFPAGQLPPVNAFWSVTMYDAKTQLLIDNPINRYLINSPMLPDLKKNADGSLTLYIQKDSPGTGMESNWLPAPDGPIDVVMRLYWPKEEALNGTWKPPAVERAE